jgi:hypothetical protein
MTHVDMMLILHGEVSTFIPFTKDSHSYPALISV